MNVLGVLGGRPPVEEILHPWAKMADRVYAADSGADSLLPLGILPIVTGDLDSVQSDLSNLRVVIDEDPDRSDCDKLLDLIRKETESPNLVIAGLEGDRLDHMLGSLSSIFAANLPCRILLDTGMAHPIQGDQQKTLLNIEGATVSLIAFTPCIVSMQNCAWPLTDHPIGFGQFQSLSNIAEPGFNVTVKEGQALLIVTAPHQPWA